MEIREDKEYKYIDEGEGEILLLLHGLFGALSNWDTVVERFSKDYRVIIPLLPIYTLPVREAGLKSLNNFLRIFGFNILIALLRDS